MSPLCRHEPITYNLLSSSWTRCLFLVGDLGLFRLDELGLHKVNQRCFSLNTPKWTLVQDQVPLLDPSFQFALSFSQFE